MENQAESSLHLPPALSTIAPEIDWLFNFIYGTSLVFYVGIVGTLVAFMILYRRKSGVRPEPTGHHNVLELFWTFSPLVLLFVMFHFGFNTWIRMATAPDDALVVRVRARQWGWDFEQPNGMAEDGQLHIPAGRPVRLVMSSSDVIHSFWVPDFRVKRDVVPGMFSTLWFEAVEHNGNNIDMQGAPNADQNLYTTQVYCTEFCGAGANWGNNGGHATMYAVIHVQREADYQAFLERGPRLPCPNGAAECPLEESGRELFTSKTCSGCHQVVEGGPSVAAPNLWGVFDSQQPLADGSSVTADEAYIRRSILEPRAQVVQGFGPVMPQIRVSETELNALVAYLRTLH